MGTGRSPGKQIERAPPVPSASAPPGSSTGSYLKDYLSGLVWFIDHKSQGISGGMGTSKQEKNAQQEVCFTTPLPGPLKRGGLLSLNKNIISDSIILQNNRDESTRYSRRIYHRIPNK
jgi:hypothetical protein